MLTGQWRRRQEVALHWLKASQVKLLCRVRDVVATHGEGRGHHEGRLRSIEDRIGGLEDRIGVLRSIEDRIALLSTGVDRVDALNSWLCGVDDAVAGSSRWLQAIDNAVASQGARADTFDSRLAFAERSLRTFALQAMIPATTIWLEHTEVPEDVVVSVITPTRDRRELLEQAIASVRAQRYQNYEHIVVDDGSEDGTADFLSTLHDPRVRTVRTAGLGLAGARNVALAQVRGAIVTYLDDDNRMEAAWLRSVVWAFSRLDDVEFLYGATIVEDARARDGRPSDDMPKFSFEAYDRRLHETSNFIDVNVIGHRAGLPGAQFEGGLDGCEDWEFGLRLTTGRPPLALPVVACLYRSHSPDRVSWAPDFSGGMAKVRALVHRLRPMRVLVVAAPQARPAELAALADTRDLQLGGADVAFSGLGREIELPTGVATYDDAYVAVTVFAPDIVVLHWSDTVAYAFPRFEATGVPFVLRKASGPLPTATLPTAHRRCVATLNDPASERSGSAASNRAAGPRFAQELADALTGYRLENPL